MITFILTPLKNSQYLVDIICIGLMLVFSLYDFNIFNSPIKDKELLLVSILSFWFCVKMLRSKIEIKSISFYDLGFIALFIYFNINFFLFSNTTIYYSKYAVFVAYFFVFYAFRWYLVEEADQSKKQYSFLLIIVFFCLLQAIVALLQYTELIPLAHPYFKLLGSFSSPNLLALYLSFGVLILLWYVFVIGLKDKIKTILIGFGLLLLGLVIVMSDSRGTFLSLLVSIFTLFITAEKNAQFLFKNFGLKKVVLLVSIVTTLFFTLNYLYQSDVSSIKGRQLIAKITVQEIIKNPLTGYGVFNFRGSYNKSKAAYFIEMERPWEEVRVGNYVSSAFNDFLLVGYELGLPFLFLALFLMISLLFKLRLNDRTRIGIALVVNVFVWSFFNSAIANIPIMLVALFGWSILITESDQSKHFFTVGKWTNRAAVFCVLFSSLLAIYASYQKVIASVELEKISKLTSAESFDKRRFINLSKTLEDNRANDFKIGIMLYRYGYLGEGYAFMEKSFEKTYHPKAGSRLALLYARAGNFKRAEEIYRINQGLEPFRYEPKMNLIALMKKMKNYGEVIRLSQKVVDFPVKIPSETVEEYKEKALENITRYSK